MSFADIKAQMRRDVHAAFALSCVYTGPGEEPRDLTVRFHDKNRTGGDMNAQGWATVIEGVTRVSFNREELAETGVTPKQYGVLYFPDYDFTMTLSLKEPYDGPIDENWGVAS